MIPDTQNNFAPWLLLPDPLSGKSGDIKVGDSVMVKTEFKPSSNAKLKKFLYGEVETISGDRKALGLNQTSYFKIATSFGRDTSLWVDKRIRYEGLKRFTQGTGHLWSPVTENEVVTDDVQSDDWAKATV